MKTIVFLSIASTMAENWSPQGAFSSLELKDWKIRSVRAGTTGDSSNFFHRMLNALTNRQNEVPIHHDINTQNSGEEAYLGPQGSRIFDDSGACGVLDSDKPCCNKTCTGLTHCTVLNGKRIEDKYYPTLPHIHGSCLNFDDRASRLKERHGIYGIFGDYHTNRPFKDTEECRQLVLDYTCLYWATMFNDRCFYRDLGKNLSGTDAYYKSARGSHLDAPRRPCRSFCLAVGLTCANDPFSWVNLCHNIDCPVEAEMCARSGNRTNAVREGAYEDGSTDCYVYKFASAYSAATHGRGDWRWVFAFTFSLVYFSISGQQ